MSTRSVLEKEMTQIRDNLLRLASLVDQAIDRATRALQEHDASLAQLIIDEDKNLNQLRYQVENDCLHVFATQQPLASDLRAIVAAVNIVVDLERMGDHAEGMSKALVREDANAVGELVIDLPRMSESCREMLRLAMDAFLKGDVDKAKEVALMDDELDHMYNQIFSDLIDQMLTGGLPVSRGTYQLWAAHNLERIGDRVTNICERVEFASTGYMQDMNP
jgi:phosphate transport system protein